MLIVQRCCHLSMCPLLHWITRKQLFQSICDSSKLRGNTLCANADSIWQGISGLAKVALCILITDEKKDANDRQEVKQKIEILSSQPTQHACA